MGASSTAIAAGCLHALSRSLLLFRLLHSSNVAGLSLITQEVFLIVYVMRYLDLLAIYVDLASTLVKVSHLGLALAVVLLIRYSSSIHSTYEEELDSTPRLAILVPPFLLALLYHRYIMIVEIFHQFSWYLEPLALIPQFVLLTKRNSYPPWVLAFTALAGAEGLVSGWPLLSNAQEALKSNPYGLYAACVLCGVLLLGCVALAVAAARRRGAAGLNESAHKPAFTEEWDGARFTFTPEQAEAGGMASPMVGSVVSASAAAASGRY